MGHHDSRVRERQPAPIDGYDWDIRPEPVTYRTQDREDALDRARRWRIEQGDDPDMTAELAGTALDASGWMHVGTLHDPWGIDLRVYWHPPDDAVRVERRPRPKITRLPPPPPIPPEPITFAVRIRDDFAIAPSVDAVFRGLPSRGREGPAPMVIRLRVPPPPVETMPRVVWEWYMSLAAHRYNPVTVPDDFFDRPAADRRLALIDTVHTLAVAIQQAASRRR